MKRVKPILIVAFCAALFWFLPLFHIVPLDRALKEQAAAKFNPAQFAEKFWTDRLLPSLDRAIKADVLLPAIQNNPAQARNQYSRSVGLSGSYTYFVSGQGRVLTVSDDEVTLAVTEHATGPEISLTAGMLFGNAIRNGTGLLDPNNFPNSQDFNDISGALNHLAETRVLPTLRAQARPGVTVRFVGCAEVADEATDLRPLRVAPIQIEIK